MLEQVVFSPTENLYNLNVQNTDKYYHETITVIYVHISLLNKYTHIFRLNSEPCTTVLKNTILKGIERREIQLKTRIMQ